MQDRPLLISGILEHGRRIYPDSRVITVGADGAVESTYAQVAARAAQLAHALRGVGVVEGDRVATFCWNHQAHLEAYLGVSAMGAVMHTLHVSNTSKNLTVQIPALLVDRWPVGADIEIMSNEHKKVFDELVKLSEPAVGSLMEGMEETLTVHKLRLGADLKRMLSTTNSIESMFSMAQRYKRNVKRWKNYEHIERTLVTTLLEAERRFRRVRGYRELKDLKKRIQEYCATTKNTMAA